MNVSVRDEHGVVQGLSARDFEVSDNGVRQTITDMTAEALPLQVTFVLDVSGSVTPEERSQLSDTIRRVTAALEAADRCAIVKFARVITTEFAPGAPPCEPALDPSTQLFRERKAFYGFLIESGTNLFDATALALAGTVAPSHRQLAIVLTDGAEESSFLDRATVIDAARFSDVRMDFVIAARGPAPIRFADTAGAVAALQVVTSPRSVRVSAAFLDSIADFRTSYVLRSHRTTTKRMARIEVGSRNLAQIDWC